MKLIAIYNFDNMGTVLIKNAFSEIDFIKNSQIEGKALTENVKVLTDEKVLFNGFMVTKILVDDNEYLSQKPKAYKKTILDMKNIGMSAPLTLENE
jgi:lipocalin